mmetsp:Transcript_4826/g.5506  ORF Transcript_4826/g.5506 Transcript_4826/m.5506 type:complete len:139 (+) Transcript_4826:1300-1716(+)
MVNRIQVKNILRSERTLKCRQISLPGNPGANHWGLLCVNMEERSIIYFDSMRRNGTMYIGMLKDVLTCLYCYHKQTFDDNEWKTCASSKDMSIQENVHDCGVFVCVVAECLSTRKHLSSFDQSVVNNLIVGTQFLIQS